jgi:predicted enzyme related to lactoylglutathione lyase
LSQTPVGRPTVGRPFVGSPLSEAHVQVHLDLYTRQQDLQVERLVALGAKLVEDWPYPPNGDFVVLRDPDGNEFCVVAHGELTPTT